jgi:hypothetical protein
VKLDCGFPAWLFDGAFDDETLAAVVAEFPDLGDPRWTTFRGPQEELKQQGGPACWGPATTALILHLLSPPMVEKVGDLVGLPHLVGDVVGGGMHQSGPGAHLDVHVDFDRHPVTGWRRAVNLLLYLNHGWTADRGGLLELHGGPRPVVVAPEFGRMVVFRCSDRSWHGHPAPVAEGHVRRSIAVYFYDQDDVPDGPGHSTVWRDAA